MIQGVIKMIKKKGSDLFITFLVVLGLCLIAPPANASLISVTGPDSLLGAPPAIISAPSDVTDDAAYNFGMEGFDEQQGVTLPVAIYVDGGGFIPAGTVVDSHMIFLNTGPDNNTTLNKHFNVHWTFTGTILGVMSDYSGSYEVASTPYLGAIGTIYPTAAFAARGLETNVGSSGPDDGYQVFSSGLTVGAGMAVTEPGDWIRVVTTHVPEPFTVTMLLLAGGYIGLLTYRKKKINM